MISRTLLPGGGGIAAYTEKTSRALAAHGHDVHVISEGTTATSELRDGVWFHRVPARRVRPAVLARTRAVAGALKALGSFDIVQACEWGGEAWAWSLHPNAPLITRLATPHFLIEELNGVPATRRVRQSFSRWLERSQARRSARVVSPSAVLAQVVGRRWRIREASIRIVPTGISLAELGAIRGEPAVSGARYVLYFGRLERRKGVETWVEALPSVLQAHPDVHAVFIGEDMGRGGRSYEAQARERCGAAYVERLHFLPEVSQTDLYPSIAHATLVVMPSRWESLANACLEAMALGRPVVATAGSGFAEVITDSVDGFLVPPDDSAALAAAVVDALGDPEMTARIGASAQRRAHDYDLDAMVERLEDVYREVIAEAQHPVAVHA